jgi:hypothetical protein
VSQYFRESDRNDSKEETTSGTRRKYVPFFKIGQTRQRMIRSIFSDVASSHVVLTSIKEIASVAVVVVDTTNIMYQRRMC